MCHIWQFRFGDPGRGRYHNKEWADRMEALDLMPSDTEQSGGKRTGQRMTHYIVDGGPFDRAAAELLASGWAVKRGSGAIEKPRGSDRSKVKFTCAACGQNAWAKDGARLVCGECDEPMASAGDHRADRDHQDVDQLMIAPARRARIIEPDKARRQVFDHAARPRSPRSENGRHDR
jgi:hypothetical protein